MTWHELLPLFLVLSSLIPGLAIFFLREQARRSRILLNMGGAVLKTLLMGVMIVGIYQGQDFEFRIPFMLDYDLVLHGDAMSVMFATLSTILWLVTTIYAIGYLENSPNRSRFFGFFSLCVSATIGIALAGNMITFVVFYELLTLATYPLVVHRGTPEALRAGRIYLIYTLTSGTLLLVAVLWLRTLEGPLDFTAAGLLADTDPQHHPALIIIFWMLIISLGVKAALVPLHGWLPMAMVAPAPVSALLHAVAVVKAGAFGIIRVIYDVYGIEFAESLGVLTGLAVIAAITVIYGSVRALLQDDLKKRLAYSTVSQVSYITLGVAIFGPLATIGGVTHLVHQGIMKITLFFCAGNLAETLHIHKVSEMAGVGRRMPWTMAAFTIGALGMIGLPPLAGFASKWFLGVGAAEREMAWVLWVLAGSSALNAAYFLPILYAAWFKSPERDWHEEFPQARFETHWMLLWPPVVTALLVLLAGLFAVSAYSPLGWAKIIAAREYLQ